MSMGMLKKAEQIVENHRMSKSGISKFQMSNFIIGKEVTIQGKQWQCIRQIESRLDSIKSMKLQIEEMEDNLELIDIKTKKAEFIYKRLLMDMQGENIEEEELILEKELNIKKRKYKRQKESILTSKLEIERLSEDIKEELNFLSQAFEHLLKRGEWKDFDDVTAQAEYWNAKLAYEVGMRMSLARPIDIELGRTIDALPQSLPVKEEFFKIIAAIKNIEKGKDGKE